MTRIYLSPPDVRGDERALVDAALASNWLAPVGPDLNAFEREIAETCGVRHAVGLSSGTAAIHLGLLALGVGTGDEVVVPTFTFAGSAFPVVHAGATPIFVDCEPATWGISPALLDEALRPRHLGGRAPAAVITVDPYGQCADYDALAEVIGPREVPVLEDAAEALGATYGAHPAGSLGTCAVLSFNGNKIVTTSGGGMFLTDDAVLADRVRHLASQAREPVIHYQHEEVGFNYRLSNLLAALGRGQLATLAERVKRRQQVNDAYRAAFEDRPGISFMPIAPYGAPNYWLTCMTLDPADCPIRPADLCAQLESEDIEADRCGSPCISSRSSPVPRPCSTGQRTGSSNVGSASRAAAASPMAKSSGSSTPSNGPFPAPREEMSRCRNPMG